MSSVSENQQSHWSTDFVEHLRTVHFALITVSTALIIFMAAHQDLDFSRALTQATQILQLRSQWDKVQEKLYVNAISAEKLEDHELAFFFLTSRFIPKGQILGKVYLRSEQLAKYEPWKFSGKLASAPATLADFKSSWDTLHGGVKVVVPVFSKEKKEKSEQYDCSADIWWRLENGRGEPAKIGIFGREQTDILDENDNDSCSIGSWGIEMPEYAEIGALQWQEPYHGTDGKDSIILTGEIDIPVKGRKVMAGHQVKQEELHFSRRYDVHFVNIDESALAAAFSDWRKGTFQNAFREVASVSNGLDQIDLKEVPDRIRNAEAQAEQNLEVFGLRVPVAQVGQWGTLLLVAVQFYFWLHLHELTGRIEPTDPGWNVAWIGVYFSRLAIATLLLSSCALPFMAAYVIGLRMQHDASPDIAHSWRLVFLAWMVYTASGILGVATAERIFRLSRRRTPVPGKVGPQSQKHVGTSQGSPE